MKRREDIRTWLGSHGHIQIVAMIDAVERRWAREGKKTHRNWWSVLAGKSDGSSRQVAGIRFPVLRAAQLRQGPKTSSGAHPEKRASPTNSRGRTKDRGQISEGNPAKATGAFSDAAQPKPFVKWAGGKRQLLTEIRHLVPPRYGTYHEPFLGGGAVFFALSPVKAFLSDSNERLVRSYNGIKKHLEEVLSLLKGYKRTRPFFLEMRGRDIDRSPSDAEVAAWFIFLNKTGFNGLYRVNSKNLFNVPYGDNKNAQIYDEENLRACSRALAHAKIECEDYSAVLKRAKRGDLVYFDPPYMPLSATSYFTSYTAKGFTREDQIKLRGVALELKDKGVHVLLSNSSRAAELYKSREFSLVRVLAARPVNSKAGGRGKIEELLITPR